MRKVIVGVLIVLGACRARTEGADNSVSNVVAATTPSAPPSSGYLVKGRSMDDITFRREFQPSAFTEACSATLIAPRVAITAAHCVSDPDPTYAFGTNGLVVGPIVHVLERHPHPSFQGLDRPLATGIPAYDIAYLVLERAVDGVTPAKLPGAEFPTGPTLPVGLVTWSADGDKVAVDGQTRVAILSAVGGDAFVNGGMSASEETFIEAELPLCFLEIGSGAFQKAATDDVVIGVLVDNEMNPNCHPAGRQFYTSTFFHRAFLEEALRAGSQNLALFGESRAA